MITISFLGNCGQAKARSVIPWLASMIYKLYLYTHKLALIPCGIKAGILRIDRKLSINRPGATTIVAP